MSLVRQASLLLTELNIALLELFPRTVFIIFKSAIRQLKIIGKYGSYSTRWYWNYIYIYIYTSLLKMYAAKLIISGTGYNGGATKHRSNLDIIRKLPFSWIHEYSSRYDFYSRLTYIFDVCTKRKRERGGGEAGSDRLSREFPVISMTVIVEDK